MSTLEQLKKNGLVICGDCGSDPLVHPEWIDRAKLLRARQILKRDMFGVFFCHLTGLSLLVYVKTILEPLLATKQSSSVSLLFRRYLGTLNHVTLWYEGDILDQRDKAGSSIAEVRRIHKKVAEKLNAKLEPGEPVSLSQYDMMITQFAFIGLIVLKPERFGIVWSEDDLNCVLHFWRVVGFLLGISEDFNLFGRSDAKEICREILNKEMRESFKVDNRIVQAHQMSQGIIESVQSYIPLMRWPPFLKYLTKTIGEPGEIPLTAGHNLIYKLMSLTLQRFLVYRGLSSILTELLKKKIKATQERRSEIFRALDRQYPKERMVIDVFGDMSFEGLKC